jgi:hypothetical protein
LMALLQFFNRIMTQLACFTDFKCLKSLKYTYSETLNLFFLSVVFILISPKKLEPNDKKLFCKSKFSGHRGLNSTRGPRPSTHPSLHQKPARCCENGKLR